MRNLTRWAAAFLFPVAATNVVPATAADSAVQAPQIRGEPPAATGRLKFKSAGPVCMCANGMSEKDIEKAIARSRLENATDPDSGTRRGQAK